MVPPDPAPPPATPDAAGVAGPRPEVLVVDLDWRSAVGVAGAALALVGAAGLVRSVPRTVTATAIAGILALALDPAVEATRRRLRTGRGAAVAAVLAALAAVAAVTGALLVPAALREGRRLGEDLPATVAELGRLPVVGDDLREAGVPERVEDALADLPSRLVGDGTPLARLARRVADALLAALVTVLLAVTMLLDGPRLVAATRRLVPPSRRLRADRLGALAHDVVGRYVAGSVTVAALAGVCVLVAGLVLGVPLAPAVAAWVAVWNLVPQIGGAVGGVPFVLLGLTQGAAVGLACAAFFVVYLQVENHVVGPLLVGQKVKLSPPATMAAALVGGSAGGVVGALLAVPMLGVAKSFYVELRRGDGYRAGV